MRATNTRTSVTGRTVLRAIPWLLLPAAVASGVVMHPRSSGSPSPERRSYRLPGMLGAAATEQLHAGKARAGSLPVF